MDKFEELMKKADAEEELGDRLDACQSVDEVYAVVKEYGITRGELEDVLSKLNITEE